MSTTQALLDRGFGNAATEPIQDRRILIIHNPVAGRRSAGSAVLPLARTLRQAGWQVELAATAGQGDATKLSGQAVAAEYGVVLAAGGDGTINEVIQPLVGSATALCVLPEGTVNLWAAEGGIPHDPRDLANLIARGRVRRVDVGRAGMRYFLLMAGLGFDAAVVRGVQLPLKRRIGRWSYVLSAVDLAPRYAAARARVRLDGRELACQVLMMVVGNTRRYAGSLRLTPAALIDDGKLDVCIIRGDHVLEGLPQAGAVLAGLPGGCQRVLRGRAARIEVYADRALPLQVDGDFAGLAPVLIEVVPLSLRVIVGDGNAGGLFSAQCGS